MSIISTIQNQTQQEHTIKPGEQIILPNVNGTGYVYYIVKKNETLSAIITETFNKLHTVGKAQTAAEVKDIINWKNHWGKFTTGRKFPQNSATIGALKPVSKPLETSAKKALPQTNATTTQQSSSSATSDSALKAGSKLKVTVNNELMGFINRCRVAKNLPSVSKEQFNNLLIQYKLDTYILGTGEGKFAYARLLATDVAGIGQINGFLPFIQ